MTYGNVWKVSNYVTKETDVTRIKKVGGLYEDIYGPVDRVCNGENTWKRLVTVDGS